MRSHPSALPRRRAEGCSSLCLSPSLSLRLRRHRIVIFPVPSCAVLLLLVAVVVLTPSLVCVSLVSLVVVVYAASASSDASLGWRKKESRRCSRSTRGWFWRPSPVRWLPAALKVPMARPRPAQAPTATGREPPGRKYQHYVRLRRRARRARSWWNHRLGSAPRARPPLLTTDTGKEAGGATTSGAVQGIVGLAGVGDI